MASVRRLHEVGRSDEGRNDGQVDRLLVGVANLHRAERLVVVESLCAERTRVYRWMKGSRLGAHEGRRRSTLVDTRRLSDGVRLRGLDGARRGAFGWGCGSSVVVVGIVVVPMKGRAVRADGDVVRERVDG